MLTVIDEFSRECLAIEVGRSLKADDVLEVLTGLFARHGPPAHIRSDNGPEFTANAVRSWIEKLGVKTLFIRPGSPWENGYNESFNGTLREEVLTREIFFTLTEAQILIEQRRREYNTIRPHSPLGYRPPAPQTTRPDRALLNLPTLRGPLSLRKGALN
jgi:transposase InsO family protein